MSSPIQINSQIHTYLSTLFEQGAKCVHFHVFPIIMITLFIATFSKLTQVYQPEPLHFQLIAYSPYLWLHLHI